MLSKCRVGFKSMSYLEKLRIDSQIICAYAFAKYKCEALAFRLLPLFRLHPSELLWGGAGWKQDDLRNRHDL